MVSTTGVELAFGNAFGIGSVAEDDGFRFVRAPGRVNLLGEHTDYSEGFVFPCAIDLDVVIGFRPRQDRLVRLYSADYDEVVEFSLDRIEYDAEHRWSNYFRGVASVLLRHDIIGGRGGTLRGMDAAVKGDVPEGAGLSSSAALEVASALALLEAAGIEVRRASGGGGESPSRIELARLCQEAENDFVGVKCGIMDQMISLLGQAGSALFLDCRTGAYELVPLPLKGLKLVICDTGVRRGLLQSEYNRRREECEAGVRLIGEILQKRAGLAPYPEPGVGVAPGHGTRRVIRTLRDVSRAEFEYVKGELPPVIAKRCAHVIGENERVLKGVGALRSGRAEEFGILMNESHESLRELYEVSCEALDTMVGRARRIPGVLGARMTGAGFGGCTVNLVREESVSRFLEEVIPQGQHRTEDEHELRDSAFSRVPRALVVEVAEGAGPLDAAGA